MYLSFFIKPETENLKEIKKILEEVDFSVESEGKCEDYRIVIFNGSDIKNFCYTGHKLFRNPPQGITSPFLVKVGDSRTAQGLMDFLRNYARFQLPYFDPLDFPQEEDFDRRALTDERLVERLEGMERTARNCNISEREIEAVRELKSSLKVNSVGEIKQKIFYFLLNEGKISLPWGGLPTGEIAKNHLVKWIEKANSVFLEHKNINRN